MPVHCHPRWDDRIHVRPLAAAVHEPRDVDHGDRPAILEQHDAVEGLPDVEVGHVHPTSLPDHVDQSGKLGEADPAVARSQRHGKARQDLDPAKLATEQLEQLPHVLGLGPVARDHPAGVVPSGDWVGLADAHVDALHLHERIDRL